MSGSVSWAGLLLLAAVLAVCAGAADAADVGTSGIRMGMSTSLIGADKNKNDIRAALKTWADTFSRETGFKIEYPSDVISRPDALLENIKLNRLDAFAMTTAEYQQAAAYVDPSSLIVDETYVNGGEEYLILVNIDSGVQKLSDLRGRNLIRYNSDIMSLAPDWLMALLASASLGTPESFFLQVTPSPKVSRAVLPVYFRQADACLVNRRSFETMGEMNPQLTAKLRAVASSPKLVPAVVAFHKNCSQSQKERFKSALTTLGTTPAGKQILAVFGSRRLVAADSSVVASAIELINTSARLKVRAPAARK